MVLQLQAAQAAVAQLPLALMMPFNHQLRACCSLHGLRSAVGIKLIAKDQAAACDEQRSASKVWSGTYPLSCAQI